jgi:autotransporter-associated beta strand protein
MHVFAVAAAIVALGIGAQSALGQATLTWNNGAGDSAWSATSGSLNWTGSPWTDGSNAVFGPTGIGTVTLTGPINANSVTFNNAGYTIAGGGNTLTTNSGGITANASAAINSAITLGANQTLSAAASTTLNISGAISGNFGLNIGALGPSQTYGSYLPSSGSVDMFPNTQLSSVLAVTGTMNGGFISANLPSTGYNPTVGSGTATWQMQAFQSPNTKCVTIRLTQVGNDIYGQALSASFTGVNALGANASGWNAGTVATSDASNGYGAKITTIVTGLAANGTVILAGANSYNGPTSVVVGTLLLSNSAALLNSTLSNATGASTVFDAAVVPHAFTFGGLSGGGTLSLNDNGSNAVALSVGNNNGTTTYSGALSGSGSLTKIGSGMLTLGGSSNYSGGTTVSGGTLLLASGAAFNGGAGPGAGTGSITVNSGATLSGTTAFTVSGGQATTRTININGGRLDTKYSGAGGEYFATLNLTGGTVASSAASAGTDYIRAATAGFGITSNASSASSIISSNIDMTLNSITANVAQGTVANGRDLVLGGFITQNTGAGSGAKSLTKTGAGSLYLLSGASTYTGTTSISGGVLNVATLANINTASSIGKGSAAGSPADLLIDGGTLQYTGATAATSNRLFTIGATGNAALDASGSAGVTMTISSTGGSLVFANAASPATLTLTGSGAGVLGANVGNSGTGLNVTSLTKAGAGTWTLNGVNTFTGPTTVAAGGLYLNTANSTPSISVSGGATFGGAGSAASAAANVANGILDFSQNTGSTFALASLNYSGGTLNVGGLNNFYMSSPFLNAGSLTTAGAIKVNANLGSVAVLSGTYDLVSYSSIGGAGTSAFTLGSVSGLSNRQQASLFSVSNQIELAVTGVTPYWNGNQADWQTTNAWTLQPGNTLGTYQVGDAEIFDDSAIGSTYGGTVLLNSGNVTPASVTFGNNSLAYTVSGSYGISGTASLAVNGGGLVTIANSNGYTLATTIGSGTLQLGNGGATGSLSPSSAITNNGTLAFSRSDSISQGAAFSTTAIAGTGGLTQLGPGAVTLNTANTYSGPTTISGGTLQLGTGATGQDGSINNTIGVTDNSVLGYNLAGSQTASYAITGNGSLYKTGTGTLTLTATNSYAGGTTVNGGTLVLGVNPTVNGGAGPAAGTGDITVNSGATVTGNTFFTVGGGNNTTRTIALNGGRLDVKYTGTGGEYVANLALTGGSVTDSSASAATDYIRVPNAALNITSSAASAASVVSPGIDMTLGSMTVNVAQGTVPNGQDLVISGKITQNTGAGSGAKSLTKNGNGTLVLSGSNTYTGTTTISGGILNAATLANINTPSAIGSGSAAGSAADLVIDGGALQYTGTAAATTNRLFTIGVSGTATLDASGGPGGKMTIGSAGGAIAFANAFSPNTLILTGSGAGVLPAVIADGLPGSSTTAVIKTGAGTWSLSGTNTYSGTTTISGGVLNASNLADVNMPSSIGQGSIGGAPADLVIDGGALQYTGASPASTSRLFTIGATGNATLDASGGPGGAVTISSAGGAIAFANSSSPATLTLTGSGIGTLGAVVSNSGNGANITSLVKSGTGTWTLAAANTYTGTTSVASGALYLNAANATTNISVAGGATLGGSGSASSATANVANGGILDLSQNTGSTFALASLAFAGSGTINVNDAGGQYAAVPAINVTTLSTSTSPININVSNVPQGTGIMKIVHYTGTIGGSGSSAFHLASPTSIGRSIYSLVNVSNTIDLSYSVDYPFWSGAGNRSWDLTSTSNWNTNSTSAATTFIANDSVVFDDRAVSYSGASQTVNINTADVNPLSVTFSNTAASYTLQGSRGITGSATTLTVNGAGVVTIATVNNYAGGTTLSNGLLNLSNSSALGTGAITISGGSLDNTSGAAMTLAGNNAQNWNGSFAFMGSQPLNTGTGGVTMNASPTVTVNGSTLTVAGAISGAGALTKNGGGTLVLAASSSYGGGTVLNAGMVSFNPGGLGSTANVNFANSATLQWNGSNSTDVSGGLVIANGAAATIDTNGNNVVFASSFGGNANGSLVKAGAGMLTLATSNTYYGGTTVNGGILTLGSNAGFNQGNATSAGFGAITVNPNATLTGSTFFTVGGGYNNTRMINLNGGVLDTKYSGPGGEYFANLELTGGAIVDSASSASTDFVRVAASGLNIATSASSVSSVITPGIDMTFGNITVNVDQGTVPNGQDLVMSGRITQNTGAGSGAKSLTKTGAGTLVLSGSNSYTGGTIVNGGTLIATSSLAIADGTNLSVGDPILLSSLAPIVPSAAVPTSAGSVAAVPEPGSLTLVVFGLAAAVTYRHVRRKQLRRSNNVGA